MDSSPIVADFFARDRKVLKTFHVQCDSTNKDPTVILPHILIKKWLWMTTLSHPSGDKHPNYIDATEDQLIPRPSNLRYWRNRMVIGLKTVHAVFVDNAEGYAVLFPLYCLSEGGLAVIRGDIESYLPVLRECLRPIDVSGNTVTGVFLGPSSIPAHLRLANI